MCVLKIISHPHRTVGHHQFRDSQAFYPGSVILQVNPITGEEEYIHEPEISFAFAEEDVAAVAEQTAAKADSTAVSTEDADQKSFWEVPDEDKEEDNVLPDLVLKAEYRSMGPFALFLEK